MLQKFYPDPELTPELTPDAKSRKKLQKSLGKPSEIQYFSISFPKEKLRKSRQLLEEIT